ELIGPASAPVRAGPLVVSVRPGRGGGEAGFHGPTLARQPCESNAPAVAVDGRGGGGTVLRGRARCGGVSRDRAPSVRSPRATPCAPRALPAPRRSSSDPLRRPPCRTPPDRRRWRNAAVRTRPRRVPSCAD